MVSVSRPATSSLVDHPVYVSACDPAVLATVPHASWGRFAWSDSGMQSSTVAADREWDGSRQVVPMLWHHFEQANNTCRRPIELVELGRLKRYADNASCPPHVDDPQPLSGGRQLSLTAVVDATPDLAGGTLVVEEPDGLRRVDLHRGEVAVFPSDARHWVEPVTSGVRVVLVARALTADGHAAGQWLWHPDGTPARRCPSPSPAEMRDYRRTLAASRRSPKMGMSSPADLEHWADNETDDVPTFETRERAAHE